MRLPKWYYTLMKEKIRNLWIKIGVPIKGLIMNQNFFPKKITADKIIETLNEFFDIGYGSLASGIKDVFKNQNISINKDQDRELITIVALAIMRGVVASFGETTVSKNITDKLQSNIFNKYFKDVEERKKVEEIFLMRRDEYSEILNLENENSQIQFVKIFCTHFFGKEKNETNVALMAFIAGFFSDETITIRNFLDGISAKFKVI